MYQVLEDIKDVECKTIAWSDEFKDSAGNEYYIPNGDYWWIPYPQYPVVQNYGWICPKCQKVNAPIVLECNCNNWHAYYQGSTC